MRSKVVIAVLMLAAAVMGTAYWVHLRSPTPAGAQAPQTADRLADDGSAPAPLETVPAIAAARKPASATSHPDAVAGGPEAATTETPQAKHEAYVAKRVAELQDLGMEEDPESLSTILSELNNEDPGIREAAVEAAVQFGSREAIPRLLEAQAQATDPKEKSAILDAVEFLKLPTLVEALGQTNQPAPAPSPGASPNL